VTDDRPVLVGPPLHVVQARERFAVDLDTDDLLVVAPLLYRTVRGDRDAILVRQLEVDQAVQTHLERVVVVAHVGTLVEDSPFYPSGAAPGPASERRRPRGW